MRRCWIRESIWGLETEFPSFLYPITKGATTIWERWDSIQPDGTINPSGMTSLNHYALGSVVDWMHRTIGGLTTIEPGYRTMRIAPKPGGNLTFATLDHQTVHGKVSVSWRIDGSRVSVDVTIPAGTSATVELPLHPENLVETVTEGTYRWSYGRVAADHTTFTLDTPSPPLLGTQQHGAASETHSRNTSPESPSMQMPPKPPG
ncbi:alpha-L-rhamnosidase C-terminal domain-containing protein [Arthrobacter sp. HS15c]|uniref:alpha-L-rhamnosidase C-terminal domain-containing protein n=1 Tax=Arthrobacter sp. HS15c TaxID=3230279 RepID=UPI003466B895